MTKEKLFFLHVFLNKAQQMFYCLALGNSFLYAHFLLVERYFAWSGSYISVVGIRHFTRSVYDTSHNSYLQSFKM